MRYFHAVQMILGMFEFDFDVRLCSLRLKILGNIDKILIQSIRNILIMEFKNR